MMANDNDCMQLSVQEKCSIFGRALKIKKHQMPTADEKQAMNKEDEKNVKQRGIPMQSLHSCSEDNLIACLARKLENAEVEKAHLQHSLEDLEMQKAKLERENEDLLCQVGELRHQLLPLPPPPPPPLPPMPMPQASSSVKLKTRSILQTVSRAVRASPKNSTYENALKEMRDRLKTGQSLRKTIPPRQQVPATAKQPECEGILQLKAMLGSLRSHSSLKGSQSPCQTRSSTTTGSKAQCLVRRQSCPFKLKP